MNFSDNEPAITAGSIVALVGAVIAVAIAFGAPITPEQKEAVLGLVAVVAPILVAILIRPHVTPQAKIDNVPVAKAALLQAQNQK